MLSLNINLKSYPHKNNVHCAYIWIHSKFEHQAIFNASDHSKLGGGVQTISQQYVSHAPYSEDSNAIEIALKVDYFKVKSRSFLVQTCRQV